MKQLALIGAFVAATLSLAILILTMSESAVAPLVSIGIIVLTLPIALRRPELPVLLYFVAAGDLMGISGALDTRMASGGIKPWDWALAYCVAFAIVRLTGGRTNSPRPHAAFWLWLTLIGTSAFVALNNDVPVVSLANEARKALAYCAYPAALVLVSDRPSLFRLAKGLVILAALEAVLAIAESLSGGALTLLAGKLNPAAGFQGVVFVGNFFVSGILVALVAWVTMNWKQLRFSARVGCLVLSALMAAAVLLTLRRNLWVTTAATLGLLALIVRRKVVGPLVSTVVVGAIIFFVTILIVPTDGVGSVFDAVAFKVQQVVDPNFTSETATVQVRMRETEAAIRKIREFPFLGIGLGATYYSTMLHPMLAPNPGWVHNGYLWIAMKMGVPALVLLLMILVGTPLRALRSIRRIPDANTAGLVLGCALALVQLLAASFVEPVLMDTAGVPTIAVMCAAIATMLSFERAPAAAALPTPRWLRPAPVRPPSRVPPPGPRR